MVGILMAPPLTSRGEEASARSLMLPAAHQDLFPTRGYSCTPCDGRMYLIGGKPRANTAGSQHGWLYIVSPAAKAAQESVVAAKELPFSVWDHAAALLPPSPPFACGAIALVTGRAETANGFTEAAYLISLDAKAGYPCHEVKLRCVTALATQAHDCVLCADKFPLLQ
jgi:hypothetical protein